MEPYIIINVIVGIAGGVVAIILVSIVERISNTKVFGYLMVSVISTGIVVGLFFAKVIVTTADSLFILPNCYLESFGKSNVAYATFLVILWIAAIFRKR